MTRIRTLSPKLLRDLTARAIDLSPEPLAIRALLSRMYWVGPQDLDAYRGARRAQLLAFGLIDDAELDAAIDLLEQRGWLVPAPAEAAEATPPPGADASAHAASAAELVEAQARLAAVSKLAETVAGDVHGMGAAALAPTGALAARLAAVQGELEAIADALEAARPGFVAGQLERGGLAGARGLKVHLGAGTTHLPGWVNCDVAPAEVAFHLSWGLPFAAGSVDYVYAGHVFEHLYYAGEAVALLREVRRVLAPGGVFRFLVPDMALFLRRYAAGDRAFFQHWQAHAVRYFSLFDTPMEIIMSYCMVGREPSEFFGHKMGYDLETIEKLARRAGFSRAVRSDFMASEHAALRVDEVSGAAKLAYEGERYSLFVELA